MLVARQNPHWRNLHMLLVKMIDWLIRCFSKHVALKNFFPSGLDIWSRVNQRQLIPISKSSQKHTMFSSSSLWGIPHQKIAIQSLPRYISPWNTQNLHKIHLLFVMEYPASGMQACRMLADTLSQALISASFIFFHFYGPHQSSLWIQNTFVLGIHFPEESLSCP